MNKKRKHTYDKETGILLVEDSWGQQAEMTIKYKKEENGPDIRTSSST